MYYPFNLKPFLDTLAHNPQNLDEPGLITKAPCFTPEQEAALSRGSAPGDPEGGAQDVFVEGL